MITLYTGSLGDPGSGHGLVGRLVRAHRPGLVGLGARVVGHGVAPAIQQVAALAAVAARVRGGFGGGGASGGW